jgi:hypothetical protein
MVSLEAGCALLTLRFLPPYTEDDGRDYLAALERIGAWEAPFALLALFGGGGKLSPAAEREQALWFKATRSRILERCYAMAIVRPDASKKMEETFRKLWPIPIAVFETETAGRDFLSRHRPASQ